METHATGFTEAQLAQCDELLAPLAAAAAAGGFALPAIAGADIFSDIWNAVNWSLQAPGNFFSWSVGQFTAVLNWITSTTGNIKDFIVARVEWVANNIVIPAVDRVYSFVTSIPGAVSAAASWVWSQVQPALQSGWNFVSDTINWLYGQVSTLLSGIGSFIQSTATWLWQSILPIFDWVGTTVSNAVNWLWQTIHPIFDWVGTTVSNGVNWLWQAIYPIFNWTAQQVAAGSTWVAGQTFNYVIQGAAALGDGFQSALEWLMHGAFGDFTSTINRLLSVPSKMLTGAYHNSADLLADLDLGNDTGGFARFMYSLCAFVPTLASIAVGLGPIYAADALQNANRIVRPTIPSLTDIRDGYLRGLYGEPVVDELLGRLGFHQTHVGVIKALFFELAPPSDLVRFLVREVFDPVQRQALQLDADFPAAAIAEFRKLGLDEEQAHNYWAAHWNLPSPSQVYEMLHRGFIDAAAVDRYLKAADFSPAWRANLAAISYNVPGRIDLRRLYAAGVFDEARVRRGYKDLGYNQQDADALTAFAVHAAAGTTKELPRGVILEAYRDGELDRAAALAELEALHFNPDDAGFMLDLEDLTNARANERLIEDAIELDLKAGIITEAQALTQLAANGVSARRASLLVATWRNRHLAKPLTLSAAQVQHAVREQLIPDNVAAARFGALGYNGQDTAILLALAHPQAAIDAPPTLSLAQLFNAFREGLLNQLQLVDRLQRKGYAAADVAILVQLAIPDAAAAETAELTKAELIAAAKKKVLPVDAVQRRLKAKGYGAQDIDTLLETQGFTFTPTGLLIEYPRRELTVAQLGKSFRDTLIDEKEYRFRLGELGYAEEDVTLLVDMNLPKDEAAA